MNIQKTKHQPSNKNASPRAFVIAGHVPLVYINMPKSGCTTIKNVLHRIDNGAFLEDPLTIHTRKDLFIDPDKNCPLLLQRLKTFPVFTFVRHPLKRSYSCFNEKIHFMSKYSFDKVRNFVAKRYGASFEPTPSLTLHRANFKSFLKFSQDTFDGNSPWPRNPHWCPQSMVLNSMRPWRLPDFIGRVENFDAHMKLVMNLADIAYDFVTPRMNEGPQPPWRYEEIVDDEILALSRTLFKTDMRDFGYEI